MNKRFFIIMIMFLLVPAINARGGHAGGGHAGGRGGWHGGGRGGYAHAGPRGHYGHRGYYGRGGYWGPGWGAPGLGLGLAVGAAAASDNNTTYIEQPVPYPAPMPTNPYAAYVAETGINPVNNPSGYRDWLFRNYSPDVAQGWWKSFAASMPQ